MKWLVVILPLLAVGGKKGKKNKNAPPPPPPTGWVEQDTWQGACFNPPSFEGLGTVDLRRQRSEVLDAIMSQWNGERGDGVEFKKNSVVSLESVLLRAPEKIPGVAAANWEQCRLAMAAGDTADWAAWLDAQPKALTKGECRKPLDYTLYDYLDIGTAWQISVPICKEDTVQISASSQDFYRIAKDGPWINAEGDTSKPSPTDYPCNTEMCHPGQLILKFRGESGIEQIVPIGLSKEYSPPEHGSISVMINDKTFFDNEYKVERGVEHHTSVEYSPVE